MIIVRICVGTYCYLAGGEELANWKIYLPDDLKDIVTFVGSACLGCSKYENKATPPYAKVGDVLINDCNKEKLLTEIYKQLGIEKK